MLTGMKRYTNNITAIVAVSEYGKEQTLSRRRLQTALPLEDIKDSIVALAPERKEDIGKLMNHEMINPELRGLKFSDIYFTAMKEVFRNDVIAIEKVIQYLILQENTTSNKYRNEYMCRVRKWICC